MNPRQLTPAGVALLVFALVFSGAAAGDRALTSDGTVHSVAVAPWSDGGNTGGSVLLHTVQTPDGQKTTAFVPGTDDFTPERDPSMAIDPVTQEPLLVWSRGENRAADVMISRLSGGEWSDPQVVWSDGRVNLQSQIESSRNLVHVVWNQDVLDTRRLRLCLDRGTLEPATPLEELPTSGANAIPTAGGSDPQGEPTEGWSYFASAIPASDKDGPGRVGVWGARDEPIPIVYFRHFDLPSEVSTVRNTRAGFMTHRFVLRFTSASTYFYTMYRDDGWSDLRRIALTEDRTQADAELLLEEMIERESAVLPE
jgi:hypothetical protein